MATSRRTGSSNHSRKAFTIESPSEDLSADLRYPLERPGGHPAAEVVSGAGQEDRRGGEMEQRVRAVVGEREEPGRGLGVEQGPDSGRDQAARRQRDVDR